eukprot:m.113177 g.113177  ORF g.113177 m.113177 type:complete len:2381 (+) comp10795_c0_seq1:217-7359(+)
MGADHRLLLTGVHPTSTNRSEDVVAVGSIDGNVFSVYCSQFALVILDDRFQVVQKIIETSTPDSPGFVAVDTCGADGKIAGVVDGVTHVYRPRRDPDAVARVGAVAYTWTKIATLPSQGTPPRCVSWNPLGDRVAVAGSYLTIWGHKAVVSSTRDDSQFFDLLQNGDDNVDYVPQTSRLLPAQIRQMNHSPDGRLIGSIADNDRLMKVWYTLPYEIARYQFDDSPGFIYLEHPTSVCDYSWRRWPDFDIHSTFVVNVLVTSCRDNLCRVWTESAADEPLGMYLTAIIDPDSFPGFEPVTSGFRLHWLDCRSLRGELNTQVNGLRIAGGGAQDVSLFGEAPRPVSVDVVVSGDDDREEGASKSVGAGAGGGGDEKDVLTAPGMTDTGAEFVLISGDGGFRNSMLTPTQLTFTDNNLASPHVPSKVTRACLTTVVPKEDRSNVSDILYFVHPNGSLVFWSVSYLDTVPRRSPYIKLISGTDVDVISVRDGASVIGPVEAYLDRGLCLWRRKVAELSAEARGDFEYLVPRSTSLSLVMHHATGDVTQWMATFADRGSFGEVLEVHETARITGAVGPVTVMETHPVSSHVVTASPHAGMVEIIVWQVRPPTGQAVQSRGVLQRISRTVHCSGSGEGGDTHVVMAWLPLAAHTMLVVACATGMRVYRCDRGSGYMKIEGEVLGNLGRLQACTVHPGPTPGVGADPTDHAFYVTLLTDNGQLTLWQLHVGAYGAVTLSAVDLEATNHPCPDASGQPAVYTRAFAIPGDHLMSIGFSAAFEYPYAVYLGMITSTGSVAVLRCVVTHDDGKATDDAQGNATTTHRGGDGGGGGGDRGRVARAKVIVVLESPRATLPAGAVRVASSTRGHIAVAVEAGVTMNGRPQFDVMLLRWQLHGTGPQVETTVFSGPTTACDLAWGTSQNQKETLYVLTDDELLVFSPATVSGFAAKGAFRVISRTPRKATVKGDGSTSVSEGIHPMIRTTLCGQVLVAEHAEVHGYNHCARVSHEEESVTLEHMVYRSGRILPQFHDVLMADLLFAGRGDRIKSILKHVAHSLRSERIVPNMIQGPQARSMSLRHVPPLMLSHLYPDPADATDPDVSIDGSASGGGGDTSATEEKYTDLFTHRHEGDNQVEEDADALFVREALTTERFAGLSRIEQVAALSLIEAYAVLDRERGSLDDCGVRFFIPALHMSFLSKQRGSDGDLVQLQPSHYAWALHSEAQEFILEKAPGLGGKGPDLSWPDLRAHGAGFWIRSLDTLRKYAETIARNQFAKTKQPLDCAIWYLAMRKKKILWGLFKSVQDSRMSNFFGYNFSEPENKVKALKNAYALMGKRRHHEAAAFFLLGGALDDAVNVCIRNLNDVQLAIVVCRLFEEDHSGESPTLTKLLQEQHEQARNPFSKTIYAWLTKDAEAAVRALLLVADRDEYSATRKENEQVDAPAALNLCRFLQNHPHVKKLKDSAVIQRVPTALYYKAYASYMRRGMPQLALDTLVDFETVFRESMAERNPETGGQGDTSGSGSDGGGANDGGGGAPPKKEYSSAVDTGTVDFFGGFGGFDDEFAMFDEPAAPVATVEETTDKDTTGEETNEDDNNVDSEFLLRLVEVWQVEECLRLIADGFLRSPPTLSWKQFSDTVDRQANTMARLCGCEQTPQLRQLILERCDEVARGLDKRSLQCLIASCGDPMDVVTLMGQMCDGLLRRIQQFVKTTHDVTTATPGRADVPPVDRVDLAAHIDRETMNLADCLQQVFANAANGQHALSNVQVAECVLVVYVALWTASWLERNVEELHALLINAPTQDLFHPPPPNTEAPHLVGRFLRAISVKQYEDLDLAADQDDDGNAVVTVYPAGSLEAHAERYRWALLDMAASQQLVVTYREAVRMAGLGSVVSPRLNTVAEALEEFLAALECTLIAMQPPRAEDIMRLGTADHSVHGLFRMRSLQEVQSNRFQTYESRRFWAFLISHENLHRMVEYHVFERSRRVRASVSDVVESRVAYSSAKTGSEIYAVCVNSSRPTQLVIGTSKGLVELTCDGGEVSESSGFAQVYAGNNTPPLFSPLGSGAPSPLNRSRPRTPDNDGSWAANHHDTATLSPPGASPSGGENSADAIFVTTMHRPTSGSVRAIAQHPVMPCYVSGTSHGDLDLWHYDQQHPLSKFRAFSHAKTKITSIHFSDLGNKFGATTSSGEMALWRFLAHDENDEPFLTFRAHSRRANDFAFVGATSLIVTGGLGSGSDGGNVALWDTLLIPTDRTSQVHPVRFFNVNESGTLALAYSKATQRLFCGSAKGEIAVVDFRLQKVVKAWTAHEGSVNKMVLDEEHGTLISGSGSGAVKLWALNNLRQIANFEGVHARSSFSTSGVIGMDLRGDSLYSSGLDGCVKVTYPWLVFGRK